MYVCTYIRANKGRIFFLFVEKSRRRNEKFIVVFCSFFMLFALHNSPSSGCGTDIIHLFAVFGKGTKECVNLCLEHFLFPETWWFHELTFGNISMLDQK